MVDRKLFNIALGRQLRLKRTMQNITLEQLATDADLDDKYLGKVERGKKLPSSLTLYKICLCLNISVDEILHEVTKELTLNNPPNFK